jgi:hypothetical protein
MWFRQRKYQERKVWKYCNVFGWLETESGLLIGFINHLQVVTTINYNTVTDLHNLHSLHANLLSLPSVVFTYLQYNTRDIQVSLDYALPISLHYNTHKAFTADFSAITHYHILHTKSPNPTPSLHTTNFPITLSNTLIRSVSNCRYIASAPTTQKTVYLLLEHVYRTIA